MVTGTNFYKKHRGGKCLCRRHLEIQNIISRTDSLRLGCSSGLGSLLGSLCHFCSEAQERLCGWFWQLNIPRTVLGSGTFISGQGLREERSFSVPQAMDQLLGSLSWLLPVVFFVLVFFNSVHGCEVGVCLGIRLPVACHSIKDLGIF